MGARSGLQRHGKTDSLQCCLCLHLEKVWLFSQKMFIEGSEAFIVAIHLKTKWHAQLPNQVLKKAMCLCDCHFYGLVHFIAEIYSPWLTLKTELF